MRNRVFIICIIAISFLFSSCRHILDFYKIPNVIYGCWQNVDDNEILIEKYNLFKNGTFEYYSADDLVASLEPSPSIVGTYNPQYDAYKVTSASGDVIFNIDGDKSNSFSKKFFWEASQEEGPLRLVFYTNEFKWEYRWAEVSK